MDDTKLKIAGATGIAVASGLLILNIFGDIWVLQPGQRYYANDVYADSTIIEANIYSLDTKVGFEGGEETIVKLTDNADIKVNYSDTDKITLELTNANGTKTPLQSIVPTEELSQGTGTVNVNFPSKSYGNYTLTAKATSTYYPAGNVTKSVTLRYLPFYADFSFYDLNKDPVVVLKYNDMTDRVKFTASKAGSTVNAITDFSYVVEHNPDDLDTVTLPFKKYNLTSGDYVVSATAYTENGELVDKDYATVDVQVNGYQGK